MGATGQIGRSLAFVLGDSGHHEPVLFSRDPRRLRSFLDDAGGPGQAEIRGYDRFDDGAYEAIVNCVGISDPAKIRSAGAELFRMTERFDELALGYLARRPQTRYLHVSSGAVYGTDFAEPAGGDTRASIAVNAIGPADYYRIAKLNAEAKHRAAGDLAIVDLRVFAFFSRFADLAAGFLLSEVVTCVQRQETLVTGPGDAQRDYVHPRDLAALVERCIEHEALNAALDVYSRAPTTKFEILDFFARRFGLRYRVDSGHSAPTATGAKSCYFSTNRAARRVGYVPRHTSLEALAEEAAVLLERPGAEKE